MSISKMGTLNYEERREFIEREAECHFENLKEAMQNNASKSAVRSFASSLKKSVKFLHELDKVVYKEEYYNAKYKNSCNSYLRTEKRNRFERLLERYGYERITGQIHAVK